VRYEQELILLISKFIKLLFVYVYVYIHIIPPQFRDNKWGIAVAQHVQVGYFDHDLFTMLYVKYM
jgi:hypothetical protein